MASEAELRIETGEGAPHLVSAVGLSAEERAWLIKTGPSAFPRVLAVYTGDRASDKPAIAGAYELDDEGLHFRPRFPFVSGVTYAARLDLGGVVLLRRFDVAAPTGEAPRVVAVFPSADALPENLLRFYLHFSQPMEAQNAHRHVRLLDDTGAELRLAFVEVEHGLWDPWQTRLTVLVHPGRIKRGVAPGERLGPPLRAGRAYRLVVDAAMHDASGRPLGLAFERGFRAVGADRASPLAQALRLQVPARGEDPLVVDLPEPLDEALLQRLAWIETRNEQVVAGAATVSEGETRWTFRPSRPWSPGAYALRLHRGLEDRAGNRFDRAFDREIGANGVSGEAHEGPPTEALRFAFVVPAR